MIETVFNSDDLPKAERFAYWHEITCRTLMPTRVNVDDEGSFRASVRILGSDALQVSTETVQSLMRAERTPKLIRRSDPEQYLLGVVQNGSYEFSQLDRESTFGVRDLILFDSSYPFHVRHQGGTHVMFRFPKKLLPLPFSKVTPLLATRLPRQEGIGDILAHCLFEVTREPSRYRPSEITRLLNIALDLLTTLLSHELDALDSLPPESYREALIVRIHAFIHQRLGDPELSPMTVADAHHISLRYLQQLFAADGTTPAAWIRRQRLERCRQSLTDPHQNQRPIRAIAACWGFTDNAHFSRLFRATYGASPSEYRASYQTFVRETTSPLRE
ncbi:helix-turn-helix domain-containing protein [Actinomadura alba]|uniref:Helix-turn-helix domain-containing protein n=1 Tax=Actinomadura alba TaxID=406431 RepID=A0ABR7LPP7_9ACTN|nr:helix-turn-helix domain-containing protein [Actinomadura alba]MBC6466710.1 helix-turn-helix domain-containing protein [Actinomadura alba]